MEPETRHRARLQRAIAAHYVLGEELGRGGSATVHAVRHRTTLVAGALKYPRTDTPAHHALLRQEAALLARLAGQPGIVRLLDAPAGQPWFVLERLSGRLTLQARPAAEVVARVRALALVLQGLHAQGFVHADLSLKNVMCRGEELVLIDLGSAVEVGDSGREVLLTDRGGASVGYAAPEQLRGELASVRSDLYALGCIFFELASGRSVFASADRAALTNQHLHKPADLSAPELADYSAPIVSLLQSLLSKDPALRPASAAEVIAALDAEQAPKLPTHRARFVGRAREQAALTALANRARAGEAGFALVFGESGIGKTRLLNELSAAWAREGFALIGGRCQPPAGEATSSAALGSLAPALRQLADFFCDDAPHAVRDAFATLAEVVPELGEAGPARSETPEQATQRISAALTAVLVARAASGPVVVIIDDAQWADEITLHFICRQSLPAAPLLVIATCRSEAQPESWRQAVAGGARIPLALERLGADEVWAMATQMLGPAQASPQLARFLSEHSEGNPFFVGEYLHAAVAQDGARPALPESIAALFATRFAQLSARDRQVLFYLAVLGRETSLDRLRAVVEAPEASVAALRTHHVIDAGDDSVRFLHDKWREAALARMSDAERETLHHRVAVVLDQSDDGDDAALGWHWAQAHEPARALFHLERAAVAAARSHLPARAVALYQLAVGVAPTDAQIVARLSEGLGDALTSLARHEEARVAYDAALVRSEKQTLSQARLQRKKAVTFATVLRFAEARVELDIALASLGEPVTSTAHVEWIDIQLEILDALYFARQHGAETDRLLAGIEERITQHGNPRQAFRYEKGIFSHLVARQRFTFSAAAHVYAERALESATALGDPVAIPSARFAVGFHLRMTGSSDFAAAAAVLAHACREAEAISDLTLLSRVLTYWAICLRQLGDVAACAELSERAKKISQEANMLNYVAASLGCLAWVALKKDQRSRAEELTREGQALWQPSQPLPFHWLTDLPELALAGDDYTRAAAIARRLLAPMQQRYEPEFACCLQQLAQADALTPREASRVVDQTIRSACRLAYL